MQHFLEEVLALFGGVIALFRGFLELFTGGLGTYAMLSLLKLSRAVLLVPVLGL